MADPSLLSERELDIMREVITGATNQQIARALDISPNTVKVHLRNIYEKLGVTSRTEATLVVLRDGLVEVEGGDGSLGVASEAAAAPALPALDEEEPRPPAPQAAEREPLAANSSGPMATVHAPAMTAVASSTARAPLTPEVLVPPRAVRVPLWLAGLLGAVVLLLAMLVGALLLRPAPRAAPVAMEPTRWTQLAQLPAPRSGAVAVNLGRDLLLMGGTSSEGLASEVWRYEAATGRWETVAPLPQPVQNAAALFVGGTVLLAGGEGVAGRPLDLLQVYDPEAGEWRADEAPLPVPLSGAALAAFEGEVYLFGGWDGEQALDTVYQFLPDEARWEEVGRLPAPRAGLGAATVQDGIVLVGGVGASGEAVSQILHFDPRDARPFGTEAPLPAPEARPSVVALGNALYVYGSQGFLERDPDGGWNALELPIERQPAQVALVASDPYVLLLGGELEEEGPLASAWQYQALFRSFIPLVPGG